MKTVLFLVSAFFISSFSQADVLVTLSNKGSCESQPSTLLDTATLFLGVGNARIVVKENNENIFESQEFAIGIADGVVADCQRALEFAKQHNYSGAEIRIPTYGNAIQELHYHESHDRFLYGDDKQPGTVILQ